MKRIKTMNQIKKKVILMMDSDFHSKEDEEYKLFVDKMNKLIDKLKPYFKVELCYNIFKRRY